MNKFFVVGFLMVAGSIFSADNEVYIDQSGATVDIDVEQLGSGNLIGGTASIPGTVTALDLDVTSATIDINQIGNLNKFLGDITSDTYTGFFEFDGDSNTFNIQTDPTNTFGADNSNIFVDVTGNTNNLTLNQATAALASQLDLDWIINGGGNTITASIDADGATNYMNLDGNDNNVTFDGDGYAGQFFKLEHTGGSRTFNVNQQSTLDNDWLRIISNGSNGTVCVNQNDQGTSTSC
jgi:hypothetical protein|tara:strand:- start:191 stop:901 length:711 start_codon:yes stop_codon:yes gene_type:complete